MARRIDTRNPEGKGLEYTEYNVTMEDWARAPKTRLDGRWTIPEVKQHEKPGEVKYYGAEFKDAAEQLNTERWNAYNRRQSNEYIRSGAKAPADNVSRSQVEEGQLREARQDFRSRTRGRADRGDTSLMSAAEAGLNELRNAATATVQSLGVAAGNATNNLRTALKPAQSFANFLTGRRNDDEGML